MATFLITGASRGLGLGLTQILASSSAQPVSHIFATSRSREPSPELAAVIARSSGVVKHVQLQVDDSNSIQAAAAEVSELLEGRGLDYVFCNAAVRDPTFGTELENMDFLREALDTNVIGTHEVICSLLPELRRGSAKKIILFSSTLACITIAQTDSHIAQVGLPAYKISKAATHMLTALWSNRLKGEGFCVYLQSPGNLKTTLAGGESADLPVEVGARETIRIALEAKPEDTGRHRNIHVKGWEHTGGVGRRYNGADLPW